MRVASSSLISRVRDAKSEPGSLKAMWPLAPMPSSSRSMPPLAAIYAS
jgi:hypothetical protein